MNLPNISKSKIRSKVHVWRPVFWLSTLVLIALPVAALASSVDDAVSTFDFTQNMHPLGFSARGNTASPFTANSDIAFWGKYAYHGNYDGFRSAVVPRSLADVDAPPGLALLPAADVAEALERLASAQIG